MFTCEICKIFKNTYFAEHLLLKFLKNAMHFLLALYWQKQNELNLEFLQKQT